MMPVLRLTLILSLFDSIYDDIVYHYQYNFMAEDEPKKKVPPFVTLPNKQIMSLNGFGTYKLQDQTIIAELLRKGLQIGACRHIDGARMYNNQIALGKAIKTVIKQGRAKREELFITSKIFNLKGEVLEREVKECLQLMQLKYLDLLYMHWPCLDIDEDNNFPYFDLGQFWGEMEKLVTKGYVKHLGISNFNGQMITQLLTVCKIKPVALQNEVHPYLPNNAINEVAQKNGITVIAHTPLARGQANPRGENNNILKEDIILDIAAKHGRTPAQVVIKFSLQRGIGLIPKTSNPARLQENWQAWTLDLTEDDMKKIRTLGSRGVRVCDGSSLYKYIPPFD